MRQAHHTQSFRTRGPGLNEVTADICNWVADQDIESGLLTLYLPHTSASLTIQENADPDVCADLEAFFHRLVPEDASLYRHTIEGPDDMPAHIKAALTQTQLSIPVRSGRPALGRWQGVYLFEHRTAPQPRTLILHLIGD